jgi:hypothetical protein
MSKERLFFLNKETLTKGNRFGTISLYSDKAILVIGRSWSGNANCFKVANEIKYKSKVNLTRGECWSKEFFSDVIVAEDSDMSKKKETLAAVKEYMVKNEIKFDAVIGCPDATVQMAAYLAEELGCLGIPLETCQTIQNKHEFRALCGRLGIVSPKCNLLKSGDRQHQIDALESFEKVLRSLDEHLSSSDEFTQLFMQMLTSVKIPLVVKNPQGSGKGNCSYCMFITSKVFSF